ncbi:MAG TPA: hypothetical protein VJA66_16825 [Thermoanaerobaculia bacterium]
MKDILLRCGLCFGIVVGLASSTLAQVATPSTLTPTSVVPAAAMTPGAGLATSPEAGRGLYAIPKTTPAGLPSYATPGTSVGPARPMVPGNCADGGWRSYTALGFKDQPNCETWLKQHPPPFTVQRRLTESAPGYSARHPTPTPRPPVKKTPPTPAPTR